jgi:hypothetical protein
MAPSSFEDDAPPSLKTMHRELTATIRGAVARDYRILEQHSSALLCLARTSCQRGIDVQVDLKSESFRH